jgi:hypothetical protein
MPAARDPGSSLRIASSAGFNSLYGLADRFLEPQIHVLFLVHVRVVVPELDYGGRSVKRKLDINPPFFGFAGLEKAPLVE